MSNFFEEDSNASDDFSWRYNIANTDYGFLIFCLENNDLQNLVKAVMSDNKMKEDDLPEEKGGGLFSVLFNDKQKKEKGFFADMVDTAKSFGSMMSVSRCKKEVSSKLDGAISRIPFNYRVEAKTSVDAVETFYTRNARVGEPVETKFKPLVVESGVYLKANKSSNVECSIIESGETLGMGGESLELSYAFLQKFYTILDPSTHLSTYAKLLGRSKNEISEWLNSGRMVSKLILDSVIESAARSYQTSLFGKRVVPENEMILVNVDGHQGGLIISKQFSGLFTL